MGANFRVVVAVAAVAGLAFTAAPASAEELVVGSFGGSFADNLKTCHVAAFEKATGATVSLKLGNSSQFAAALRAAGGKPDMDIVYIDNSLAAQAHNEGLTQTIDRAKVKSAPDILPSAWGKDDSYVVAMVSATTLPAEQSPHEPERLKADWGMQRGQGEADLDSALGLTDEEHDLFESQDKELDTTADF